MAETRNATISLREICSDDYIDQETIEIIFQGNRDEETDARIKALGIDLLTLNNYVGQLSSGEELPKQVELLHDGTEFRVLLGNEMVTAYAYLGKQQVPAVVHDLDSIETPTYKRRAH